MTVSDGQAQGEGDDAGTIGVDVTLINDKLRLSPAERLRQDDRMAASAPPAT